MTASIVEESLESHAPAANTIKVCVIAVEAQGGVRDPAYRRYEFKWADATVLDWIMNEPGQQTILSPDC
jgi:hypothetical protein